MEAVSRFPESDIVNRRSNLTPYRHPVLTEAVEKVSSVQTAASTIRPLDFFMNRILFVNEATRNFPLDEISTPDEDCAEAPTEICVATKMTAGSKNTRTVARLF
jgi:hypothetical protein